MTGNVRTPFRTFRYRILFVLVAEASYIIHIIPPVRPIKSPILWGPRISPERPGRACPLQGFTPRNSCARLPARGALGARRTGTGSFRTLLIPVAKAPHIIHIVPPVLPIKSPILWGPGFYLSDQAKPVRSKVSHCETLVRASRRGAPLAPGELAPARSVLYSSR